MNSIGRSTVLGKRNCVTPAKRDDVRYLMQHFAVPDSARGIYDDVLAVNGTAAAEASDDGVQVLYDEVEPFI